MLTLNKEEKKAVVHSCDSADNKMWKTEAGSFV